MAHNKNRISRDGFTCSYGRFFAEPYSVERVEGSSLCRMFLPKLTPAGQKLIYSYHDDYFVRGQLKLYGVEYDESEMSGNGTRLLKKLLEAGECDEVPEHLVKLRDQMHSEWLETQTPEQLSSSPEWVMERYFLTSGQPDYAKTTAVVGIPLDRRSSYRSDQMRNAARKVAGLHQETGYGSKTQTIFMGWDSIVVSEAAKDHAAKEAKEVKAEEEERTNDRLAIHSRYLNTLKRKGGKKASRKSSTYSPVGSYMVDCEDIEGGWSDQVRDLSLDIFATTKSGVFQAEFHFGIIKGVMVISSDENALDQHCAEQDEEIRSEYAEESEDEDEVNYNLTYHGHPATGTKRKAGASTARARPPKKPKAEKSSPYTYYLRLKCRETEGEIHYMMKTGTIKFADERLVSFTAEASIPIVGRNVIFTGRKTSETPNRSGDSWANYSESAYNYANSETSEVYHVVQQLEKETSVECPAAKNDVETIFPMKAGEAMEKNASAKNHPDGASR